MMWLYKILIVEDEPLISTLIRSILEEGVTTAQVVGEAVNGRIALQMIADLAPDIVLTDINLPTLSGLQVIRRAREAGFAGKFVVISGYNEFSYVQQALRFGVDDYLLKPIDDGELCRLVTNLTEALDASAAAARQVTRNDTIIKAQFLNRLVLERLLPLSVCNEFYSLHFVPGTFCCVAARFRADGSVPLSEIFAQGKRLREELSAVFAPLCSEVFTLQRGTYVIALLNYSPAAAGAVQTQLEGLLQSFLQQSTAPMTVGVSHACEDFVLFQDTCRQVLWAVFAQRSLKSQFFYVLDFHADPLEEAYPVDHLSTNALAQALCESVDAPARDWLQQRMAAVIDRWQILDEEVFLLLPFASRLLQTFFETVARLFPQVSIQQEEYLSQLENCASVQHLQSYLTELVQRVKVEVEKQRSVTDHTIDRITDYISAHLSGALSLEEVARAAYLTPGYLSEYFKSKMDTNFKDYVLRLRMERAKYLLGKNVRVQEIAAQCGYSDVKYFCKIFKKYYGVAPTDYRRMFG